MIELVAEKSTLEVANFSRERLITSFPPVQELGSLQKLGDVLHFQGKIPSDVYNLYLTDQGTRLSHF